MLEHPIANSMIPFQRSTPRIYSECTSKLVLQDLLEYRLEYHFRSVCEVCCGSHFSLPTELLGCVCYLKMVETLILLCVIKITSIARMSHDRKAHKQCWLRFHTYACPLCWRVH